MNLADAVGQLKPDASWKGVRLEGRGMNVEDRSPLHGDARVLPSATRFAGNSGCTSGPLARGRCGHTSSTCAKSGRPRVENRIIPYA
jgi:hypothetical protein